MSRTFPAPQAGVRYLTEGGVETELMYKFGFELPEFAIFTMLHNADALAQLRAMYERYLDTAAKHAFVALMGGLDYRASPDWAKALGYSPAGLEEMQIRAIDFLRDVARPYVGQLPAILYSGVVGPRGDAYTLHEPRPPEEFEEYHSTQIGNLAKAGVDLVQALTFNSVDEAIGVARAAAHAGLPASVSFTLDSNHRLHSGPTLREAIEAVDTECGDARPAFFGVNCSHPLEFLPALEPGAWFERVRCLRPNAAALDKIALCQLGHLESGNPIELGQQMGALSRDYPHLDIWGGCCGTWETHLDEIAQHVLGKV